MGNYIWLQREGHSHPHTLHLDKPSFKGFTACEHAAKLADVSRWSGAKAYHGRQISVAEHAVLVAALSEFLARECHHRDYDTAQTVRPELVGLLGLHHDDHEAFPPFDIPGPLERELDCPKLKELKRKIDAAVLSDIYDINGVLDEPLSEKAVKWAVDTVKLADQIALFVEGAAVWRWDMGGVLGWSGFKSDGRKEWALRHVPVTYHGAHLWPVRFFRECVRGDDPITWQGMLVGLEGRKEAAALEARRAPLFADDAVYLAVHNAICRELGIEGVSQ